MDKTSIPTPAFPQKLVTPAPPSMDREVKEAKQKDAPMKDLAEHPGWHRVREKFEDEISKLENIQSVPAGKSDSDTVLALRSNQKAALVLRHIVGEIDQHAGRTS